MTVSMNCLARSALIVLAGLGTVAGLRLSIEHLQHGEVCPVLGPIPACFIVFAGYALILAAAIFIKRGHAKKLFYTGWTPVFLLALMGVTLELTKGHVCPEGAFGIPQCFFSLAMVLACLGLFRLALKAPQTS